MVYVYSLAIILYLLLFPSFSLATTYYVAKTGNDTTGNGSEGNPWRTIGKCMDTATCGDTCTVANGSYNEEVDLFGKMWTKNCTSGTVFTVKSTNKWGAEITTPAGGGAGPRWEASHQYALNSYIMPVFNETVNSSYYYKQVSATNPCTSGTSEPNWAGSKPISDGTCSWDNETLNNNILCLDGDYNVVDGFKFTNNASASAGGYCTVGSSGRKACLAIGGDYNTVQNNYFNTYFEYGIYSISPADHLSILNNYFHEGEKGIIIGGTNWTIDGNEMYGQTTISASGADADHMRIWGGPGTINNNKLWGTNLVVSGSAHNDCFQHFEASSAPYYTLHDVTFSNNHCENEQGTNITTEFSLAGNNLLFYNNVFKVSAHQSISAWGVDNLKAINNTIVTTADGQMNGPGCTDAPSHWESLKTYAYEKLIAPAGLAPPPAAYNYYKQVTVGGCTSGATQPNWAGSKPISDGTCSWDNETSKNPITCIIKNNVIIGGDGVAVCGDDTRYVDLTCQYNLFWRKDRNAPFSETNIVNKYVTFISPGDLNYALTATVTADSDLNRVGEKWVKDTGSWGGDTIGYTTFSPDVSGVLDKVYLYHTNTESDNAKVCLYDAGGSKIYCHALSSSVVGWASDTVVGSFSVSVGTNYIVAVISDPTPGVGWATATNDAFDRYWKYVSGSYADPPATLGSGYTVATLSDFTAYFSVKAGGDPAVNPAIDAGTDGSGYGFSTDKIGTSRPQGAAWEMGAYEYLISGLLKLGSGIGFLPGTGAGMRVQ